jgi:ankyrin repeat protein
MDPHESRRERRKDNRPRNSRNDEHDTVSSQPKNRPSRKATRKLTSASDSEQSQARAGGQEDVLRNELPSRARHRGHDYQHVYTSGNARAHFGNQYIEQQNILPRPADETDETKREKFMEDLGFNLMDSRLATIGTAHVDTCDWLFANEAYLRWQDRHLRSSHHGFLWIKGKPGAGKSTLMKHALRHEQSHNRSHSTILSYFFNARGHGMEKTMEGMYRSLLHQVFKYSPRRVPKPPPGYLTEWKYEGWPVAILQDWFRQAPLGFGAGRIFTCFIDALDECNEDSIRLAIDDFEELGELANSRGIQLSICFASRHYPRISIKYHETINLDVESKHQDDILTFIRRKLHGERSVRLELEMKISSRCSGVFLWAALVVRIMNQKTDYGATRSQLLDELSRVPTGIEELLHNIILNRDITLLPTLQWVLFSRESLSVYQLYLGIMASLGRSNNAIAFKQSHTSGTQMRAFILTSSRGLVEFTTSTILDDRKAQFIHETVREYLLSGGLAMLDHSLSGSVEAISHARLGQWCSDYIEHFPVPEFREHRVRGSFESYAANQMLGHMEVAYSGKGLDLRSIDAISQRTWLVLQKNHRSVLESIYILDTSQAACLYVLIEAECTALAEAILQRQLACSSKTRNQTSQMNCKTPKMCCIDVNTICGPGDRDTALLAAINSCNRTRTDRLVKLLLKCGADPNLAVVPSSTPLREALRPLPEFTEDPSLVRLLLENGADPNIPISSYPGGSVLGAEVRLRRGSVVKLLLDFGANVRGHGTEKYLCIAAAHSTPSMVRILLAAGANVDERDRSGHTALHLVIKRKGNHRSREKEREVRAVIAQVLLDAGADVDAMCEDRETATMLAFRLKQYGLARLLLDRGADPNLSVHREIVRTLRSVEGGDYDTDRTADSERSDDSLIANAGDSPPGSQVA